MRVGILGAGAIGGSIGVHLSRVGHDVSLLARGENLAAIRASGLTLIEPDGSELTAPGLRMSGAVGELDGNRSARSATISRALTDAGFKSRVVTDIRSQVWVKAWGNLAFNPISALTGATLDAICAFAPSRDLYGPRP